MDRLTHNGFRDRRRCCRPRSPAAWGSRRSSIMRSTSAIARAQRTGRRASAGVAWPLARPRAWPLAWPLSCPPDHRRPGLGLHAFERPSPRRGLGSGRRDGGVGVERRVGSDRRLEVLRCGLLVPDPGPDEDVPPPADRPLERRPEPSASGRPLAPEPVLASPPGPVSIPVPPRDLPATEAVRGERDPSPAVAERSGAAVTRSRRLPSRRRSATSTAERRLIWVARPAMSRSRKR